MNEEKYVQISSNYYVRKYMAMHFVKANYYIVWDLTLVINYSYMKIL